MQLAGAFTALVTPFRNGKVDEDAYRELIEWQINEGIHGLVPCGTTGESATLSHDEHKQVISVCIDQAKGRVPVIAGAGSNNTLEAINLLRFAKEAGADAGLMITPYYNKPTQDGLVQHFKAIAAEVSLPMIIYNVPGRTGVNVTPATMARLFKEIPSVIGAKEATANLTQISDILEFCGPDFILLSGDDFTVLPIMAIGGKGVISVSSNISPAKVAKLCDAFFAHDLESAKKLHYELQPVNRACFYETNPIPVKAALAMMGKMSPELRMPMTPLAEAYVKPLRDTLTQAGLLR